MNEFSHFATMYASGISPIEIARRAQQEGLGEIDQIRLLRTVCHLSLPEAKETLGLADVWSLPQPAEIGSIVYWEGWNTIEGYYAEQGRIIAIEDDEARVKIDRKFLLKGDRIEETAPQNAEGGFLIPLSYFQKPLVDRLEASLEFVRHMAEDFGRPA